MNKLTLLAGALTLALFGCSDTTNDSISASASIPDNERILPFFVFKEDGSRLAVKNGELVEKEMNRSTLVLGADESFASLKKKYEERLSSDSTYLESLERPADYVCDNVLLAINSDYDAVVSSSGETLLNDLSFYKGCKSLVDAPAYLKKNIELVDYNLSGDAWVEESQYGRSIEGYKGKYGIHVSSSVHADENYNGNWAKTKGQPFVAGSQVDVFFHLEKEIKVGFVKFTYLPVKAFIVVVSACTEKCGINNGKLTCRDVEKTAVVPGFNLFDRSSASLFCNTSRKVSSKCYDACAILRPKSVHTSIGDVTVTECVPGYITCEITEFADPLEYGVVSVYGVGINDGNDDLIVLKASTSANLPKNVASKVFNEYLGDVFSGN